VSALLLRSDLPKPRRRKESHGRIVLSSTDRSPGGRITVVSPQFDGSTFRARTLFGSQLAVPIERIVGIELTTTQADHLVDLSPSHYVYTPYLDESWPWTINRNVCGRDFSLAGSAYDRGISMHADSRLTYVLDRNYRRFDALVGLDDLDGRKGQVQVRVLVDGKPADLGKSRWTHQDGVVRISVNLAEAKELILEVSAENKAPIQAVVNWVEARMVR
jgi:hypothetical protein